MCDAAPTSQTKRARSGRMDAMRLERERRSSTYVLRVPYRMLCAADPNKTTDRASSSPHSTTSGLGGERQPMGGGPLAPFGRAHRT
eukprot:scaffold25533_cov36-Tisochrysis_lutea.AAC.3